MDTSKIIRGVVSSGRYTVTAPIIKEDYGLYLKIEGVELPSTYEVDFSNSENSGTSVTMIGNADGVLIPHQFIDTGKDIFAFLYHVGADFGRTVYKFRIPNKVRPDRTDETPTPEEQSVIDQTIAALNDAVEQTAQDVASADASAQSASEFAEDARDAEARAAARAATAKNHADRAEQARDDAQTYANNASASATASAQSASQAQGYAQTASAKADAITGLTAQATTLPDGSSATASYNAETGVMSFGIPKGKDGTNGVDGDDGYSPSASVNKSGKVATITITDQNGTTSAQVEDGTDGTDGISPTVTITPITGGHRITITDADGEHSADVMDGTGNVDDVQINGTSIVSDRVANVPIGDQSNAGVVKGFSSQGVTIDPQGRLKIERASDNAIKLGAEQFTPIVPYNQYRSAFYGLAKASGDTTQSQSNNAVGTYTESAKSKIQDMLGVQGEWELVVDDISVEDVTLTYDLLNTYTHVFAYIKVPIASANASLTFELKNSENTLIFRRYFSGQISASAERVTLFDAEVMQGMTLIKYNNDNSSSQTRMFTDFNSVSSYGISQVTFSGYGGVALPVGTTVKVYAK